MITNGNLVTKKANARQYLLSKRLNLSDQDRSIYDAQIFSRLISQPFFQSSSKIALYFSHLNEPQLVPLILNYLQTSAGSSDHKLFYLPILKKSDSGSYLLFGPCTPQTRYKNNLYDIPEPDISPEQMLTAAELDLILMPLVGFDADKNRLGMGGGFYDRTLNFKLTNLNTKPYLVGIAYECQKLESIPNETHDIRLNNIITESQLY